MDRGDLTNPQPQLSFATTDDTSGIDRYEIKIGDGDWLKIEPELSRLYKMPLQLPGARKVIIRAFDKAGNYTESDYQLEVQSIEPAVLDQIERPQIKIGESITIEGKAKPNQNRVRSSGDWNIHHSTNSVYFHSCFTSHLFLLNTKICIQKAWLTTLQM